MLMLFGGDARARQAAAAVGGYASLRSGYGIDNAKRGIDGI